LRAVKAAKHKQFAEENDLKSYFVSAKTGDQVNAAFRQVASELAGISLSKADLDIDAPVLKAQIVNHPQNDPDVKGTDVRGKNTNCSLQ
jgi:Ras-related protein Rab-28